MWNILQSKAEIERRRRARMNGYLDQLKMYHLTQNPNTESKLEKIDIMDLTIKHLQNVGNEQSKGRLQQTMFIFSSFLL